GSALELSTPSLISDVLLKALVRAQVRLAVGTALVVAAVIAALPIAFALFPSIARTRVLGIPLPWLILGPTVFPLFLAAGWLYERRAHRIEAEFEQLLESR
ncbi:MAG TPA: hypothetical protein VMM13_15375, partial [Euzebya sp.]|nr:hypothetical protein [Euzebya sp.]